MHVAFDSDQSTEISVRPSSITVWARPESREWPLCLKVILIGQSQPFKTVPGGTFRKSLVLCVIYNLIGTLELYLTSLKLRVFEILILCWPKSTHLTALITISLGPLCNKVKLIIQSYPFSRVWTLWQTNQPLDKVGPPADDFLWCPGTMKLYLVFYGALLRGWASNIHTSGSDIM